MKFPHFYFSLLLSFLASIVSHAQSATDYKLIFDKREMESGTIKIKCGFTVDFNGKDSLLLDFGGNLEDLSVEDLRIHSADIKYHFNPAQKKICFHKNGKDQAKVSMEYVFMNFTSAYMYGGSGAEIWEYIYTSSGEFYYPMKRGDKYSGKVRFIVPDSLEVVSSANKNPERWHKIKQMVPVNFAFLDKTVYEKNNIDSEKGSMYIKSLVNRLIRHAYRS